MGSVELELTAEVYVREAEANRQNTVKRGFEPLQRSCASHNVAEASHFA